MLKTVMIQQEQWKGRTTTQVRAVAMGQEQRGQNLGLLQRRDLKDFETRWVVEGSWETVSSKITNFNNGLKRSATVVQGCPTACWDMLVPQSGFGQITNTYESISSFEKWE